MRSRQLLFLTMAALLLYLLTPMQHASNAQQQDAIIWSADHEEGTDQDWLHSNDGSYGGGEFNNGCAGVSPAHGLGRNPSDADPWPYSLVLMLASPCGTQPSSGARMFRFAEPRQHADLYYKVWYYFPQRFTLTDPINPWWIIMAWKAESATRSDPFFSINVANRPTGEMFIHLYEYKPYDPTSARSYGQTLVDLPVAQWFYIEAYYSSRGDATGQVTIWQGDETNRVLLFAIQDVRTRFPDEENSTVAWAVTNYSNGINPVPAEFLIDDAEIRTQP